MRMMTSIGRSSRLDVRFLDVARGVLEELRELDLLRGIPFLGAEKGWVVIRELLHCF
jgi:hypothetical protein